MKIRAILGCLCFFCLSVVSLMAQEDWVSVPAAAFTHADSQYPYVLQGTANGWGVRMNSSTWGTLVAPVYFANADGKTVKNMMAKVEDTSATSNVIVTLYRVNETNGTSTAVFSVSSGEAETYTGRTSLQDWLGMNRMIDNQYYSWWIHVHFSGSSLEEDKVRLLWVRIKYE